MGGYGSGRWGDGKPDRKPLVEHCWALDIHLLAREGVVRPNVRHSGLWEWRDEGDRPDATVGFVARTGGESGTLLLRYSVRRGEGEPAVLSYAVPLESTRLPSGGRRWWFCCAACRDGGPACGRRVGKLYLSRFGRVFACRHCYGLGYASGRENYRGGRLWDSLGASVGIDGRTAKRLLNRDAAQWRRMEAKRSQGVRFDERIVTQEDG